MTVGDIHRAGILVITKLETEGEQPMNFKRWGDVREQHIERIGIDRVQVGKEKIVARIHMQPLVDKRKELRLTQHDVAERMAITIGRVSQIESGEVSGLDVLERYARALGGCLTVSINFPDVETAGDEAGTTELSTTISS